MVLHLVPLAATDPRSLFDIEAIRALGYAESLLTPLNRSHASDIRYNFDGILASTPEGRPTESYLQVFRNSAIESADTSLLKPRGRSSPSGSELYIPSALLGPALAHAVDRYTRLIGHMGVGSPFLLGLSLLNVRGYWMFVDQWQPPGEIIDRDHLILPEILVEDLAASARDQIQPALDAIWQACGYSRDRSAAE
jgi:hypothetical protein